MVITFTMLALDMVTTLYLLVNHLARETDMIIARLAVGNPWLATLWFVVVALVILALKEILLKYNMGAEYRSFLLIYSFWLLLAVINNISLV